MSARLSQAAQLSCWCWVTSLPAPVGDQVPTWYPPDTPLTLLPSEIRARMEDDLQRAQTNVTTLLSQHLFCLEHIARLLADRREMDGPALAARLAEAVPEAPHCA